MLKNATIAGIALAGAVAASGASAHESYGHSHYSGATTSTYGSTYTVPSVNLGPIEYVQPSSTVQYVQPTTQYIQPATTSTYTYPTTNYTTPSYSAQTIYTAPSYTSPTYTAPNYSTTYTAPSYGAPTYYQPRVDLTAQVQTRLDRQRSRIRNAMNRGDLRKGERRKLRRNMREISALFRSYKSNDGVIDQREADYLTSKLNRQSQRIRRLANNHRVVGPLVSPYGHSRY